MKCNDIMELMQRHLDLDLSLSEEQAMLAHLQVCPDCADLFERLKLLSGELAELPKVKPPYSIVDSILPQLAGLGGFAEPSAAADQTAILPQAPNPSAVKRNKRIFSWRIVSGVAAAGLVLGMFIFNMGEERRDNQTAEGFLRPQQRDNLAMAGGGENSGKQTSPANTDNAGSLKGEAGSPEANNEAKSAADAKPSQDSSSGGEPAAKDNNETKTSAMFDTFAFKDQAGEKGGVSRTDPGTQASSDAKASELHAASASAAAQSESNQASTDSAEAASETGTGDGGEAGKGAHEGERVFGIAKAAPNGGADSSLGFAPSAASAGQMLPPAVSLDGAYTASLSNLSVTITDKQGNVVFVSGTKLVPGDAITFLGWSEGSIFTYSVKSSDGKETLYRISASERKEWVL